MTIIPLDFTIERDAKTFKKIYKHKHTGEVLSKPVLPKGWTTTHDFDSLTPKQVPSFGIRCDDDLVVIDCDDLETTEFINDRLVPTPANEPEHYIVQSDKGYRHYYFRPSEYYRKSSIYRQSRLSIGKIDLLHGRALVFAPCNDNKTKHVLQGDLEHLTEIPQNIVDALTERLRTTLIAPDVDFKPLQSYLGPKIEQALALYARKKDYATYLMPLFQIITPYKYRAVVEPTYHPDLIPDGEGTEYIQAVFTRLGQDPSVSKALLIEIITLITRELWQDPWSEKRLQQFIDYIPQQKFSATQKPVFVYDSKAVEQPLVSINGNEYMPLYRTLDDDYIISKPTGSVELVKGLANFKKAMASKNYDIIVSGAKVNLDTTIGIKKLAELLKTVQLRNAPYYETGEFAEEGSLYYNMYKPTKFLGIIRSQYKQDTIYTGEKSHPTITKIIKNIMYDNLELTAADPNAITMYDKFIMFLAHKLKTLDYSPLVFQMMGNRGIGKSLFMAILDQLTAGVVEVSFSKSNAQFNEEQESALFLNEDEGLVTTKLVNSIKKLSGKAKVLIEGKGKTPYMMRNVGTYVCTTNKTIPLAETIDDRRFVTFSGFKAPMLTTPDLPLKIALELESFALCLRDTKLINPRLYLDANEWHDQIHIDNFTEQKENTQDGPGRLAEVVYSLNHMSGIELHKQLASILGEGYHVIQSRKQPGILYIPLNRMPRLVRLTDRKPLTHEITREHLKAVGLDMYVSQDKNGTKSPYGVNYYRLVLKISLPQYEEWVQAYSFGADTEIEGDNSSLIEGLE